MDYEHVEGLDLASLSDILSSTQYKVKQYKVKQYNVKQYKVLF